MNKTRAIYFLIAAIASILVSCSLGEHPVVGRWKPEKIGVEIAFYPDGTASFMMMKVDWTEIDRDSVKIEFTENNETMIVEFRITTDDKGPLGILYFFGEQRYRRAIH